MTWGKFPSVGTRGSDVPPKIFGTRLFPHPSDYPAGEMIGRIDHDYGS